MRKVAAAPRWQRALVVLTGTVVGVVVVSCLYWAQAVFVPVALAVFFTFLLAPLVTILQRRGLGRLPSVILVVLLAALVLSGVVWLAAAEVTGLASDLPTYTENLKGKIRSLRQVGQGSVVERLEKMVEDLTTEWKSPPAKSAAGAPKQPPGTPGDVPGQPTAVLLQPEGGAWLSRLPALLRVVVESLGGLALALVLVVFMLLKREDLRNRMIRLVGHGRLTG